MPTPQQHRGSAQPGETALTGTEAMAIAIAEASGRRCYASADVVTAARVVASLRLDSNLDVAQPSGLVVGIPGVGTALSQAFRAAGATRSDMPDLSLILDRLRSLGFDICPFRGGAR